MERDRLLAFTPVSHPDPRVRRIGFELADPYVEQWWGAVVGPSCTLLLRRLPELWRQSVPVEMQAEELSCSLGLGHGVGRHSRINQALKRLDDFGLTHTDARPDQIDVYSTVSPLRASLTERSSGPAAPTSGSSGRTSNASRASIEPTRPTPTGATCSGSAIEHPDQPETPVSSAPRPSDDDPQAPSRLPRKQPPSGP
jgi:hypothetical protein